MPRFAANLGFLFTEHPFLDRFAAAREAGFDAVEFAAPYVHPAREIASRLADNGLECELFNLPVGEPGGGPTAGIGCRPESVAKFRENVSLALEYAQALGTRRMNCITGVARPGEDPEALQHTLVENLRFAAAELGRAGCELVIEPINTHDAPGFFVATAAHGARIVAEVGAANLGLQCDLYHTRMMGDDPRATLTAFSGVIRHVQFADVPGRGEPGSGTMDFAQLFETIDALGYTGWVAAEYRPTKPTGETLHWFR